MVQYRSTGGNTFTLLHRYYQSLTMLYTGRHSLRKRPRNERGLYLGGSFIPERVTVYGYIDLVHHPWMRYNVDGPSNTIDAYLLGSWRISSHSTLDLRYKYKRKEKNISLPEEDAKSLLPYTTQKIRLRWLQSLLEGWEFRTTADMAIYKEQPYPAEKGIMLSQLISYRGTKPLTGDLFFAFFDAESYEARLYSYERNLLSTFYMPFFYGKGIRVALNGKYSFSRALSLSFKAAHTRYSNRDTIGSGTSKSAGTVVPTYGVIFAGSSDQCRSFFVLLSQIPTDGSSSSTNRHITKVSETCSSSATSPSASPKETNRPAGSQRIG